jgi:soluble cytochrome b562
MRGCNAMLGPLERRVPYICAARGRKIKAALILAIACALLFQTAVTSGCGEDRKQARRYMNRGDALYQKALAKASEWETHVKTISSAADQAAFQTAVEKSHTLGDEVVKTSDEAAAQYKKIYDLKGVKDYKDYADIRISQIDVLQEIIQTMNGMLDKALALGNSGNQTEFAAQYQEAISKIETLTKKGNALEKDAANLRLKKEL